MPHVQVARGRAPAVAYPALPIVVPAQAAPEPSLRANLRGAKLLSCAQRAGTNLGDTASSRNTGTVSSRTASTSRTRRTSRAICDSTSKRALPTRDADAPNGDGWGRGRQPAARPRLRSAASAVAKNSCVRSMWRRGAPTKRAVTREPSLAELARGWRMHPEACPGR